MYNVIIHNLQPKTIFQSQIHSCDITQYEVKILTNLENHPRKIIVKKISLAGIKK